MTIKITSFTAHQAAEGMRVSFTYSQISKDGNLIKSNIRVTIIVTDNEINSAIDQINNWLLAHVPQ